MKDFIKVTESRNIKEQSGFHLQLYGHKIALFRYHGEVYALRDVCPHQGAPISNGIVRNGLLVCPHHGWTFRLEDGAFTHNELVKIRTYPVKEQEGIVYISL